MSTLTREDVLKLYRLLTNPSTDELWLMSLPIWERESRSSRANGRARFSGGAEVQAAPDRADLRAGPHTSFFKEKPDS